MDAVSTAATNPAWEKWGPRNPTSAHWYNESRLQRYLAARGIETLIHYPTPIPRQPALAPFEPDDCPIAARVCGEILSLPLHHNLRDDEADEVAAAVAAGIGEITCAH